MGRASRDEDGHTLTLGDLRLVRPAAEHLPSYVAALERGWLPDSRRSESRREELERVRSDPDGFLRWCDDADGTRAPAGGGAAAPTPRIRRWIWDGEFAGVVVLRWPRDGGELPEAVPGHVAYSVVDWKRRRGYATRALALVAPLALERGLKHVDLVTVASNEASQAVIRANGGTYAGTFRLGDGDEPAYRFRIVF